MKKKHIETYVKAMDKITLSDEAKRRIARNCARYSTLHRIKSKGFVVIAVKTEKTTDGN